MQEVPEEISLVLNVSGCPHKCEGCHSKYLWEYKGNYVSEDLPLLIDKYEGLITCVCFMGGDQNIAELKTLCEYIHNRGYKFCLYTGSNTFPDCDIDFDYIKIGRYIKELGGLSNPQTNQHMYKKMFSPDGDFVYTDITYLFKRREILC